MFSFPPFPGLGGMLMSSVFRAYRLFSVFRLLRVYKDYRVYVFCFLWCISFFDF